MNNLEKLRKLNGLSQKKVAQDLHLTQGSISLYELGKRTISSELLIVFADYYGVTTDEILGIKALVNVEDELINKRILERCKHLNTKGKMEVLRFTELLQGNQELKK